MALETKNTFCYIIRAWPKLGKKIDLTSKLGEINDIEDYKGSKIYPQNQVILDCIMGQCFS